MKSEIHAVRPKISGTFTFFSNRGHKQKGNETLVLPTTLSNTEKYRAEDSLLLVVQT